MASAIGALSVSSDRVFTDYRQCMERCKPDLVILCPAAAEHADWTERIAPFGSHILMERPFASSLTDADRMIAAIKDTGKELIINWPLRWVASHVTAKRVVDQGTIGDLLEEAARQSARDGRAVLLTS